MNYILGLVLLVVMAYSYIQQDEYDFIKIQPAKVVFVTENIVEQVHVTKKTIILPKKVEAKPVTSPILVKKQVKIIPPKKKSPLRAPHKLRYTGYSIQENGNILAMIEVNRGVLFVSTKDYVDDKMVLSLTTSQITIDGFLPNKYRGEVFSVNKVITHVKNNQESIATKNTEIVETKKVKETKVERKGVLIKRKPRAEIVTHQQDTITPSVKVDLKKEVVKSGTPRRVILRSLVGEIKTAGDMRKYFSLQKMGDGYRVSPRAGYESIFRQIGFKHGDVVVKVNNQSVNSNKTMMNIMNISSAKILKVLVKNNARYRVLKIDLLKVLIL